MISRPSALWPWSMRRETTGATGLLPGLLILAALIAVDIALGRGTATVGSYLLAPFVPAFAGSRKATLLVSLAALGASALSGTWNDNAGDADYWVRTALVAFGGVVACAAATITAGSLRASHRLSVLDRVAGVAAGSASAPAALASITDAIVPELGDICTIDVLDAELRPSRAAIRAVGPKGPEAERLLGSRTPSLPAEMCSGEAVPEPRVIGRLGEEELESLLHAGEDVGPILDLGIGAVMTIPLLARGRCTGALSICSLDRKRRYGDEDVRFASILSDRIAHALDGAGLFSDLQSAEGRMEAAMSVLGEAVVIHDARGRAVFANAAAGRMLRLDPARSMEGFSLESLRGRFELSDEQGEPLDSERFTAVSALRGEHPGEPQIVRAVASGEGLDLWVRATSSAAPGPDGRPAYVVTAIEDVSDLKRVEFEQTLLARLGGLLASSLDYEKSVASLSEIVVPDLSDWCSVFASRRDGAIEEVATAHTDPEQIRLAREILEKYPPRMEDSPVPGRVLRDGKTIVIRDAGALIGRLARDARHLELLRQLRPGPVMILPMRSGGRVVGALVLGNEGDRRPFDPRDQALAERIALRAAGALDNAQLATERAEIAETLQRGLLPAPLPDIPGWDVAALYRPAGAENEVGGDFYDAFPFEGGWMILIGDVTGRGAQAASVTGQARHTVRAAATLTGDPLATLGTLNRTLLARRKPALCSLAAIALDGTGSRTARIAVAGHPPPLLVGPAGVREAAGTGPVLGAFPDARWELSSVDVDPEEQIVVFTDGVTEAESSRGRFGEERLRACLGGTPGPRASIAVVNGALDEFCSGAPGDDAALLAMSPHARDAAPLEEVFTFST